MRAVRVGVQLWGQLYDASGEKYAVAWGRVGVIDRPAPSTPEVGIPRTCSTSGVVAASRMAVASAFAFACRLRKGAWK